MAYGTPTYLLCKGRKEPELDDLLDDPVMRAVMDSDRVDNKDLRTLIDDARTRLMTRAGPAVRFTQNQGN